MDEESLPRKILAGELYYAKLWLVCVALRGVSWDKMPFEQRELAFQAKDAASNCLSNLLDSPTYRAALRYAVHDTLVMAAFSGLFLLKMANLFPAELDLAALVEAPFGRLELGIFDGGGRCDGRRRGNRSRIGRRLGCGEGDGDRRGLRDRNRRGGVAVGRHRHDFGSRDRRGRHRAAPPAA